MRFFLVPLIVLVILVGGCITTNRKHNAIHRRATREQLRQAHENLDRYMLE